LKVLTTVILTAIAGMLAGAALIYGGAFNPAADEPHSGIVFFLTQAARERSIALRSRAIVVPNLTDPKSIAAGASEYAEMCTSCHLAPGMADNELRPGLYPHPPNLADHRHDGEQDPLAADTSAARQFWIVKHGIKMTGMPAWGKTHDDATIWTIVAFIQELPTLTPEQYREITQESEAAHEASGHNPTHGAHGGDADHAEDEGSAPHTPDPHNH